jgi:RimJ/RimL family protein N-acetyltransferase
MTTFPDISISTERLVLRPFDEADVPALTDMMRDDLVTAWSGAPHPYTEAHARDWVVAGAPAVRARGRGVVFAIGEFLTQRLVGVCRIDHADWRVRSAQADYLVAPWARGEGYAAEAVLGAAQWLLEDQRFERLELRTAADNTAAQQVARKIGCLSEGVLRNAGLARVQTAEGRWTEQRTDLIVWSLLPEDLDGPPGSRTADGLEYAATAAALR